MASFYIYTHIRGDNGRPFYVGKGTGRRAASKSGRNTHWHRIVAKHGYDVRIVADGLDEELAFLGEVELIDKMRRLGATLANMTAGGEGARLDAENEAKRIEAVRAAYSLPENRAAIAEISRSVAQNPELLQRRNDAIRQAYQNPVVCARAVAPMRTELARANHRRAMADPEFQSRRTEQRARPVECIETGVVFTMLKDAVEWLRSNGHPSAQAIHISQMCRGQRKTAYKHRWRFVAKD